MNPRGKRPGTRAMPIRDQCQRGGKVEGFTRAHQSTRKQHRGHGVSLPREPRRGAPDDQAGEDDPNTAPSIRQIAAKRTEESVRPEKYRADQAELERTCMQIPFEQRE